LSFRITGRGAPVTAFDVEHEKKLHLIVVGATRRLPARPPGDGGGRHLDRSVRPRRTGQLPGLRRLQADGQRGGHARRGPVAPGDFQPATYTESEVFQVDGYEVSIHGHLDAGSTAELTAHVTKEASRSPTWSLPRRLRAPGALRGGDLATARPSGGTPGDGRHPAGPDVTFFAEVPTPAPTGCSSTSSTRVWFRTAEFTLTAEAHS